MKQKSWSVYVVKCRDGTLYTGSTTDIVRRLKEHNTGKGARYTRSRVPIMLAYKEPHLSRIEAQKREAQIKRWSRCEKLALIEQNKAAQEPEHIYCNMRKVYDRLPALLLRNIKNNSSQLKKLLGRINSHWCYEDLIYRFYHGSFKVYALQHETAKIAEVLKKLAPEGYIFCSRFQDLMKEGAGNKQWKLTHNKRWDRHTRVFLEAFFHARYFLEMAIKYGKSLYKPPLMMPSGWAALLSLYQNETAFLK